MIMHRLKDPRPDPIVALKQTFDQDSRPHKVDLLQGVIRNDQGECPIMRAVQKAERRILAAQRSKAYGPLAGLPNFCRAIENLVLGREHPALLEQRVATLQTPGGTGALRISAELLKRAGTRHIWIGEPTWSNYAQIFSSAGIEVEFFPHTRDGGTLAFGEASDAISRAKQNDAILFQGCGHNPSGVDPQSDQWNSLAAQTKARGLIPVIDLAYQGLCNSLEKDAASVQAFAGANVEALVAFSCSKNFGLYQERTGALLIVGQDSISSAIAKKHGCAAARALYSVPPHHGALVVTEILEDPDLDHTWREELSEMQSRIKALRSRLARGLADTGCDRFRALEKQNGLFSWTGLSREEVRQLRRDYGIYLVENGRINVAGLNEKNINAVCRGIRAVAATRPEVTL